MVDSVSVMEGMLNKKGGALGMEWQPRYFHLNGTLLQYYLGKGGEKKGEIELRGATVSLEHGGEHAIRIELKSGKKSQYLIAANTENDRLRWLDALQRAAAGGQSVEYRLHQPIVSGVNDRAAEDQAGKALRELPAKVKPEPEDNDTSATDAIVAKALTETGISPESLKGYWFAEGIADDQLTLGLVMGKYDTTQGNPHDPAAQYRGWQLILDAEGLKVVVCDTTVNPPLRRGFPVPSANPLKELLKCLRVWTKPVCGQCSVGFPPRRIKELMNARNGNVIINQRAGHLIYGEEKAPKFEYYHDNSHGRFRFQQPF
eukprot:TRINITY_DN1966_c0_g1_i1.p1 TRINITY_DN1966_c0_g1~~TRINITY_DN1966_c0_g1_i1.p1  ORF type:complete len:316 (-),score=49.73 TRINITY_DN1966_c0_g1_i1:17-964(-)